MKNKIGIIDYGLSNLLSIQRAMERVGAAVEIISQSSETTHFDKLVLPGVGAFPDGMKLLNQKGFIPMIQKHVASGQPFFGICLGMQMMLSKGFEMQETEGLNLIEGSVEPLPEWTAEHVRNRIPNVGWGVIREPFAGAWRETPLQVCGNHDHMYFVHSYHAVVADPSHRWAEAEFGSATFTAAIRKDFCFGTQFHPEKSGEIGLEILKSFVQH